MNLIITVRMDSTSRSEVKKEIARFERLRKEKVFGALKHVALRYIVVDDEDSIPCDPRAELAHGQTA